MTEILLKNNSDVYTLDIYKRTPLFIAVKINSVELIKLLIKYGSKTKIGRNCYDVNLKQQIISQKKLDNIKQ